MTRIVLINNVDDEPPAGGRAHELWELWSPVAATACAALRESGATVEQVDVSGADLLDVAVELARRRPDVVVNFCETLGQDSRGELALPALLDLLAIPYTGSAPLALGLALHKDKAKAVLRASGVPTPAYEVIEPGTAVGRVALTYPLIVKPVREDASEGIDFDSAVTDTAGLARAVARIHATMAQAALVEEYIDGRELSVPIIGNPPTALPVLDTEFGPGFGNRPRIVTWNAKWDPDADEFIETRPCELDPDTHPRVVQAALDAHVALGCRDYSRIDLRLSHGGVPYVIDVNPNCDLQPGYDLAASAEAAGIAYPDLLRRLVDMALERAVAAD